MAQPGLCGPEKAAIVRAMWVTLPRSVLVLLLVLVAANARGEMPTLPFPPPPPSAIGAVAGQLAVQLYVEGEAVDGDVAFALTLADPPAEARRPAALADRLGDALEAALRSRVAFGARRAGEDGAIERVDVVIVVERGQLSATARRVRLPDNVWDRLARPDGEIVASAFATRPVDLEVRTLLGLGRRQVRTGDLRLVPVTARSAPSLTTEPILDLLVADLDDDRMVEVVVLHPRSVRVVRWAEGGLSQELASFDLGVIPPHAARLREPLGRLVRVVRADGTSFIVAASSDRAGPALLTFRAGRLEPLTDPGAEGGWPLYATGVDAWVAAAWPRGVDVLSGPAREHRLGVAPTTLAELPPLHDLRARGLHAPSSPSWSPILVASLAGGGLALWSAPPGAALNLGRHGLVHALTDFDQDGSPELLTTSAELSGRDRLTLYGRLDEARAPLRLWTGAAPAPVTAAAGGDIDQDGFDEVILATWDGARAELLILVPRT